MIISKFVHSCLLIKDQGKTLLIDPGIYGYEERALDLSTIQSLDYLLITHEHADHMSIPFIKEIVGKFPDVQIISNKSVVDLLANESIKASADGNDDIIFEDTPHEKVFGITVPQNSVFTIFNRLTHPGDSLQFKSTSEILALPIQAPWGSLTQAVEYALSLKPKYVVPIHDWHWNKAARDSFYQRLETFFKEKNIIFKPLQTGQEIEV